LDHRIRKTMERIYTPLDQIISAVDNALRTATGQTPAPARPSPAGDLPDLEMPDQARRHAAGLMRINHTGEICAQALYAGQAATARSEAVRAEMAHAAAEEVDHLAWCEQRLQELNSVPSVFNPLWYAGSFALGATAGLAGDGWSLGFVQETEIQVEAHLEDHLQQLPADDQRSNAILEQMKIDEAEHAARAKASGAFDLPAPIRDGMRVASKFMKAVAYRW
jgi:ubiquinone biosynthesis monooxygenase Coq7